jgi:hypothetical protein
MSGVAARRGGVRALAAGALIVLSLVLATCVRAEDAPPTPGEWQVIKRVIGDQLRALRKDDGTRAFTFARAHSRLSLAASRTSCAWCTPVTSR